MLDRPDSDSDVALADWLESWLLFRCDDDYLATADVVESLEAFDMAEDAEVVVERLIRRIRRRRLAIGEAYPVEVKRRGYARNTSWEECLPYSFLVLLSLSQHYRSLRLSDGQAREPGELFEALGVEALGRYVCGDAFRFGSPRRPPVPPGFVPALAYLHGRAKVDPGSSIETGAEQDDGLDIIAWRPFTDDRPGHSVLLGQCAIGVGWDKKFGDLKLDVWERRIAWNVKPGRAFLVPIEMDLGPSSWRKALHEFGVIFDRLRIVSLVGSSPLSADESSKIRDWCAARLPALPTLQ